MKMKWICIAALMVAVCGWPAEGEAVGQGVRIAFVDLERVFEEFYKTRRAYEGLERQARENRAERDRRMAQLREMQEQYRDARENATDPALSEAMREEKRSQVIDLELQIQRFREESEELLTDLARAQQADEQRIQRRLVDEIMEKMESYSRSRGFDAVLDSSGMAMSGVAVVLYVDPRHDITNAVIEMLNEGR